MRAAGYLGLFAYHHDWVRNSGIRGRWGVCREHRFWMEIMRIFIELDQLDFSSVARCEMVVRWLFQIELVVDRNSKSADIEGFDALVEALSKLSGSLSLPSLSKWVRDHQQEEAFSL